MKFSTTEIKLCQDIAKKYIKDTEYGEVSSIVDDYNAESGHKWAITEIK